MIPSLRVRRIRAAVNPKVIAEIEEALAIRWSSGAAVLAADVPGHAATVAGMFAAMATEPEVAEYLRNERVVDPGSSVDVAFAAELSRIVLRLDEVGGR